MEEERQKEVAKAILVATKACEVAQARGAFRLDEAKTIAEAVEVLKTVVKVEDEPAAEPAAEPVAEPVEPAPKPKRQSGRGKKQVTIKEAGPSS